MAPTQAAFVAAVMDCLGVSQTELGVLLKKPNAYQTVHYWTNGRAKLGYEDTMRMLELCGWLNITAAEVPAMASAGDRLEALVERVGKIATTQNRILKAVLALQEAPAAQPEQGRVPAKRKAK